MSGRTLAAFALVLSTTTRAKLTRGAALTIRAIALGRAQHKPFILTKVTDTVHAQTRLVTEALLPLILLAGAVLAVLACSWACACATAPVLPAAGPTLCAVLTRVLARCVGVASAKTLDAVRSAGFRETTDGTVAARWRAGNCGHLAAHA